ncbi:MAG: hypothetical protein QNJ73_13440 [Gammaproteobacteria bacterium]|nr:hypothetical protein [Gammaproteobacteria bacterium]
MQHGSEWWSQCAFVRDFFFGEHQKVAHQVAEYLARYYVGDAIAELSPATDVSALISDSIRRFINRDDFTLVRDDNLLDEVDFTQHITFRELVELVHDQRTGL